MSDKDIADAVDTLFSKGYVSDYGDTDYFYGASEEDIDKAYDMLDELKEYGVKAFKEKYGV